MGDVKGKNKSGKSSKKPKQNKNQVLDNIKLRGNILEIKKINPQTGEEYWGRPDIEEITSEKYGETVKYPDVVENSILSEIQDGNAFDPEGLKRWEAQRYNEAIRRDLDMSVISEKKADEMHEKARKEGTWNNGVYGSKLRYISQTDEGMVQINDYYKDEMRVFPKTRVKAYAMREEDGFVGKGRAMVVVKPPSAKETPISVETPEWLEKNNHMGVGDVHRGEIKKETEKAVLFYDADKGTENWLPKSQITIHEGGKTTKPTQTYEKLQKQKGTPVKGEPDVPTTWNWLKGEYVAEIKPSKTGGIERNFISSQENKSGSGKNADLVLDKSLDKMSVGTIIETYQGSHKHRYKSHYRKDKNGWVELELGE